MARTPADATRFTATGPYASSSPSFTPSPGSQIQFGASAPANETPQAKIARLRAAAELSKRRHETGYEKTVRIGRIAADRAHRYTAMGLIGLTVLIGMVATAGISDMVLHNRRRRNEWLAEKRVEEAREVAVARQSMEQGTATEDQILLINRERAKSEAAEAKKNRPGIFKRSTGWLFGGLSTEEKTGGRLGAEVQAQAVVPREEVLGEREDRGVLQAVQVKVEENRRSQEKVAEPFRPHGGPLDMEAQRTVNAAIDVQKSWTSWLRGN